MKPYLWICANCGWKTEESFETCPKCQNRVWGKITRIDETKPNEPPKANITKKLDSPKIEQAVKDYLQQVSSLFNSVECGKCHAIIYRPETGFDREAFETNLRLHYLESSRCNPKLSAK